MGAGGDGIGRSETGFGRSSAGIRAPYRPENAGSPIKSAGETAEWPLIREPFALTFPVQLLQPSKDGCRRPNKHRTTRSRALRRGAERPRHEAPCNAPLAPHRLRRTARHPRPRRRLRGARGGSQRPPLDRGAVRPLDPGAPRAGRRPARPPLAPPPTEPIPRLHRRPHERPPPITRTAPDHQP